MTGDSPNDLMTISINWGEVVSRLYPGEVKLIRLVGRQRLLHSLQIFLVQKEGLEERIPFHHGIPVRSAAPEKFKFQFVLIKYNPVIGGVGKDEFLLIWGSGQMMFSSEEQKGGCR